ncbi:MAG: sigma-70 family RNA polymerase sigma factor [Gammaproteobacteria bacterium]
MQQHDDRHAFAELVRRYQSRLRYSLRQLTGYDEALADDLAQETFIKAYRNLRQFRGGSAFFTWLYRIAWRCFADHHRKRRPDEVATDSPLPDSPYESDERDALHMDFARALLHFGPEQRMALHLHLQREFTHREVAEIMDRPLGTVKSHIQRGRPILQQLLVDWET